MGLTMMGMLTWEWISVSTLRKRFGSIWGIAWGRNISVYSRITSSIYTMIL